MRTTTRRPIRLLAWVLLAAAEVAAGLYLGDLELGLIVIAASYFLSWNRWPDRHRNR
jgi:hypothetical protein